MSETDYLRSRAVALRDAAATALDPDIAGALNEVAAEFEREAREEATLDAVRWSGMQQRS